MGGWRSGQKFPIIRATVYGRPCGCLEAIFNTAGWPACGEIDIMEYVSFEPNQTHFSIHSIANNHVDGTQVTSGPVILETIEEEFHNYGIIVD